MSDHDETLLRVEHLCQYFQNTRAVDDGAANNLNR